MANSKLTLRITNKAREGYRRAGMAFVKGVNDVAASAFNEDQLAALEADPHLSVEVLDTVEPDETANEEGAVADGGVDDEVAPATDEQPEADGIDPELQHGMEKLLALVESGNLELNSSGKPNADVLGVNAAQRDQIWQDYQQQANA